jgi:hypothetical protein
MKQIHIPIPLAILAVVAIVVAAVVAQLPEIKRYLKIERM